MKVRLVIKNVVFRLFIGFFAVANLTCDDPLDDCSFYDHPVENFTQTGIDGQPKVLDNNDWRISPRFAGDVEVSPAFPNPSSGYEISVRIYLFNNTYGYLSNIGIIGQDNAGRWVNLQTGLSGGNTTPDPGTYEMKIDLRKLSASGKLPDVLGLKRIYIINAYLDSDLCKSLISYGDIQITN